MKKMFAIVLATVLVMSLAACGAGNNPGSSAGGNDSGKYVIGICQFMPHDALDAATEGFKAAVEEGLGKDNVEWKFQDAAGDASTCSSIVGGFVSDKVDLIMANATPALVAAANATETIPVLGTSVTEYGVALDIADFDGTVGYNVSGTSDLADLEKQAQMVLDWVPTAKKVAMVYCNAEANSKYQVTKVMEYLTSKNVECKEFSFADTNDMSSVVTNAAAWADAIYIPTDNTAANNAEAIGQICVPAGVPVIAGEESTCKGCGIATMTISYYDLGYATGKMAVKVLKDGADITKMPIEYAPDQVYKYNEKICQELNIEPLEGYEKIG